MPRVHILGKSEPDPLDSTQSSHTPSWFPRNYRQWIDALWRLTCIALAVWSFTHTQPPLISFSLLGAGQSHNVPQLFSIILKSFR